MNEKNRLKDLIISKTAQALRKNFFTVHVADSAKDALDYLLKTIPVDSSIGFGGSRTLEEIGFFDEFTKQKYPNLFDRNDKTLSVEQKRLLQLSALGADYFVSSCNAMTKTGELTFIDMWGNRCGGMTYGPKTRIVVASWNKITEDLISALDRQKNTASVLNNIRFDTKNPCTVTGECSDCSSDNRICGITTVLHRSFPKESVHVVIVKEELGF